ncbi:hypothetical protein C0584_04480 [Candidatus Parcubacteria bacterium]|nr:MAG: hypothetical protein C0584_04480 [Candidatus Parcubacteria bacterium]
MVNPNISLKKDKAPTLTPDAKALFRAVYRDEGNEEEASSNVPKIKVSTLISKMAFYYEKIRNSVDYKEEYLLRKNAIERILRREIVIQGSFKFRKVESAEVSKSLLTDLIRAGYLPNNKIPESKIDEIALIIKKYIQLKAVSIQKIRPADYLKKGDVNKANELLNIRNELATWILAVAASDIEDRLKIGTVDKVITENMYKEISKTVQLPDDTKYNKDLEIQVLLSIYRNYLKYDRDMLGHVLMKYYEGDIAKMDDRDIEKIAHNMMKFRSLIDSQIDHPLTNQLNRIASRYTVFFSILKEVLSDGPEEVYNNIVKDPKSFPRHIKRVCERIYGSTRKKLWRAAMRSFVYIFLTKSVLAVILEVPATKFFGEELNFISLAINVSFPALLLIFVVAITKKPNDENTAKIVDGINQVFFEEAQDQDKIKLRKPSKRRSTVKNFIFAVLYTITFFTSFGAVLWVLDKIHFSWVSMVIFMFFLAFVSFFTIRIRKSTNELLVVEPKESIFGLFSDFFYVPIVASGKWLSEKFDKVNVFVFVLDFIIEAPFRMFVEITEEWTKYVKERRDEIV